MTIKRICVPTLITFLLASCYEVMEDANYDYENGQTLIFVPELDHQVDSVVYYWDSIHIDTRKEMPFELVYPISEQESGPHTLKYGIHYTPWSYRLDNNSYRASTYRNKTIRIK